MTKIRIVQFGCGKASKVIMKYAIDSGGEIIGAFDINPALIGCDIGEVMETKPVGVTIKDASSAEEVLRELNPDVCIVATRSLLKDVEETLLLMARLGINTVTSCEEAFYPWNSSPEIAAKIDKEAKKSNCTISGTGYQDMSWCNLATVLAGSCNKIDTIKITTSFNLDNYGVSPALIHGAGMKAEELAEGMEYIRDIVNEDMKVAQLPNDFMPSFAWNSNGWLCDKMGLSVRKQSQKCIPHTYDTVLQSKSLGMNIMAGYVTGMTAIAITETFEDVTIITESIGKIYTTSENDINICKITGDPSISCVLEKPENVKMACAAIIGRIPDIINSPPGFVPTSRMPIMMYRSKSINNYLIDWQK